MNNLMIDFFKMLISSIPESDFDARLKEYGIEDRHIKTLRQMVGYDKPTDIKEGE